MADRALLDDGMREVRGPLPSLCSKQPHYTNAAAVAHLAKLLELGDRLDNLNIYWCPICNAEHVGHKRKA
jgi:hypothetical protein